MADEESWVFVPDRGLTTEQVKMSPEEAKATGVENPNCPDGSHVTIVRKAAPGGFKHRRLCDGIPGTWIRLR